VDVALFVLSKTAYQCPTHNNECLWFSNLSKEAALVYWNTDAWTWIYMTITMTSSCYQSCQ